MALTSSIQSQIAFKNISGKSQTDPSKSIYEETVAFSFTIPSTNVYLDTIPSTASNAVLQGIAVGISASLTVIPGSSGRSFQTYWPSSLPNLIDSKSGLTFSYGRGSLSGINSGDKMTNLISDSNGVSYTAVPYDHNGVRIYPLSSRDWVYQYSSGVFYQNNNTISGTPSRIDVYAYLGAKVSDLNERAYENIRITATGLNSYYATYSRPTVSTYSSNHLYLVEFANTNTSGTVSLNINSIGTFSVFKYVNGSRSNLSVGDLIGPSGSNFSQTYYLLYKTDHFELFDRYPVSDSNKFTNASDTTDSNSNVFAGSSFNNVNFADVLSQLIYPQEQGKIYGLTCVGPTATVFGKSYDVGATFSTVGTFTFSFTVDNSHKLQSNTLKVQDVNFATVFTQSVSHSSGLATFRFPSGYSNNIKTSPGTTTLKVSVQRTDGVFISDYYNLSWMWRIYYGSSTFSTLTASQITSLESVLSTQSIGYYTFSNSGYKYFAVPNDTSYNFTELSYRGLPLAIAGTTSGYTYSHGDLNFMYITLSNTYGYQKQYKVYRTENKITSSISIRVTN